MGAEHDLKEDDLQRMGISGLIGFGIMMGIVHVLTGLDHMSALAQLSCGSRLQGFFLGCRWGLGHSVGLCIMYGVFRSIGDLPDDFEHHADIVVGCVMLGLGLYGYAKAYYQHRACQRAAGTANAENEEPPNNAETQDKDIKQDTSTLESQSPPKAYTGAAAAPFPPPLPPAYVDSHQICESQSTPKAYAGAPAAPPPAYVYSHQIYGEAFGENATGLAHDKQAEGGGESNAAENRAASEVRVCVEASQDKEAGGSVEEVEPHDAEVARPTSGARLSACCCCTGASRSEWIQRFMALFIGTVHGAAGPGAILGVLPAISLTDPGHSAAYLASFCIASIFSMEFFGGLWEVQTQLEEACLPLAAQLY